MGLGTGTPCCVCNEEGLCNEGEAIFTDDFESYQQAEDLRPYGYLQSFGAISSDRAPIATSDGSGGLLMQTRSNGTGVTNRYSPVDVERFSVFKFEADFVSWFSPFGYTIGMGAYDLNLPTSQPNHIFKMVIEEGFTARVYIEVGGNRTIFPPPPGHPLKNPAIELTISSYRTIASDPDAVYLTGNLRGYDRVGSFDETHSFELSRVEKRFLCAGQYGVLAYNLKTDNWDYSAT